MIHAVEQLISTFTDPEMGDLTLNVGIIEINENKIAYKLNLRYPINLRDVQTFLTKPFQLKPKIIS